VTRPTPLRVLLCEPYFTGSHRSWAEGIVCYSRHDVRLVTHTGGFWKWRMQGAALTLAEQVDGLTASWGHADVVVASDMVHLPALLGLARQSLSAVPVVLYMHENQLTYPLPEDTAPDHTYAMVNWLSMAAADRVLFNSEHHLREVFEHLPALLARFPDHRHTHLMHAVRARSEVVPVGIDTERFARSPVEDGPPVVVWNHRWEYDKDPEAFFAAVLAVAARGVDFRVIVAGESYQTVPDVFERGRRALGDRVIHFGTASDDDYPRLLAQGDVVVSTARHEFFGVAVVEAVTAGCLPLLPHRLSYPELVPSAHPYLYDHPDGLVARLTWALTHHDERKGAAERARQHAQRFAWPQVAPRYDRVLGDVAARANRATD
jgi:glycosyltransferase involved in cell wall biosynthesis